MIFANPMNEPKGRVADTCETNQYQITSTYKTEEYRSPKRERLPPPVGDGESAPSCHDLSPANCPDGKDNKGDRSNKRQTGQEDAENVKPDHRVI
jgi:hypothetical protein